MILKFTQFTNTLNEDLKSDLSSKISDKYKDLKENIIELIEKSLKTSDNNTFEDFIKAFVKNPDDTKIEGLINDAEIYEFYLKYRNEIDEILSDVNFYEQKPSEMNVFGVYDYIIKSTNKAIQQLVEMIQSEVSQTSQE